MSPRLEPRDSARRLRPISLEPLPAPRWTLVLQHLALALAGLLVAGITAMFVLLALMPRTGLYGTYSVMSGSMSPAIRTGSVVLVFPEDPSRIRVGDVIAVTSNQPPYASITHRVTRVVATRQGPQFKTKGDANTLEDPWQFGYNGPAGRVRLAIPLLGYVLAFSGSTAGRLVLAGCIGLLLVGYFLPAIWRSTAGKQQAEGSAAAVFSGLTGQRSIR